MFTYNQAVFFFTIGFTHTENVLSWLKDNLEIAVKVKWVAASYEGLDLKHRKKNTNYAYRSLWQSFVIAIFPILNTVFLTSCNSKQEIEPHFVLFLIYCFTRVIMHNNKKKYRKQSVP